MAAKKKPAKKKTSKKKAKKSASKKKTSKKQLITKPSATVTPKKMGAPSRYSKALAEQVCQRIADGESVRSIGRDTKMPDKTTIIRWLLATTTVIQEDGSELQVATYPDFRTHYEHARQVSYQLMADSLTDIADDGTNDFMMRQSNSGEEYEVQNHEVLARSRLRVDTRKWFLSKVLPKMYGDKIVQEHQGEVKHTGVIEHKVAESMNFDQVRDQRVKLKVVNP